ncbi:ATP-binding protein [Pseudomonas helleri]|uniref:ATP-binding protein n=1 Tax=Pseudomonas helleri TaxID=1608996 RepID=UPI00242F860C|nr:ATP-binding protein [Pseudomonas helleri]
MPIRVNIHEAGALRNQRYAFTDRFTLVSELLQNARRAGATGIEIDYNEATQTLQVCDNGTGIKHFQALLSIHQSGWDAELRDTEQAFGVGFSQCLYSARQCVVASGYQRIDFDCAAALAQQPIEVIETAAFVRGTCVELRGVELPGWQERIERLCVGFPLPVRLNGKALARPLALSELQTQPTNIGEVFLLGRDDGWSRTDMMVFLQGCCVWRSPFSMVSQVNVVHLDPCQFLARLPDHDTLMDEDVQLARIKATLQDCWQQLLRERLEQLGEQRFLERYYSSVQRWEQRTLLNGLAWLPREICQRIEHYPEQPESGKEPCLQPYRTPISRQAIEHGDVQLVALQPLDDVNGAVWALARARNYILCDRSALDERHWAHPHVLYLDEHSVQVTAQGEHMRVWFRGRWVNTLVVLCETISIRNVEDDTRIEVIAEGLFHHEVLYIPCHEWSGKAVRQASNYTDNNERYHEADAEADQDALAQLIRRLRSRDPLKTLRSLLGELHLERYPALQGQQFVLQVGDQDHALVVECLATAGGAHAQS